MKKLRNKKPYFSLFLGVILVMTFIPPVLGLLGFSYSSPVQGGPGTQYAGLILGDIMLQVDLVTLGFTFLIILFTVLHDRVTAGRFSLLLGATLGLAGLISSVQFICGSVTPEGRISFSDGIMETIMIGRLCSGVIAILGLAVIRWGHTCSRRMALAQLFIPGGIMVVMFWYATANHLLPFPIALPRINMVSFVLFCVAAAMLYKELRHHRLRFFGHAVLAAFLPQAVATLLLVFSAQTVVDNTFHIANLLRWFSWMIPATGLGIDYVNTFYAKGLSVEMRYLRTVIDSIPHFIFARDTQGRFTLVNQAVADFYNLKVHEVEGRHLMDIHPLVAQSQEWLAEDKETLKNGVRRVLPETVATREDGQDIWIDSIKTPLTSMLGLNDQVLGVSIDISEQRRAEIALAEALDAAEESNKAKSEFLANMSHEIRTPMNCVIGLADLLKDMDPNPRQQQYLDMIRMSGATLLTLINDILDISKIESGQLELDVVDTDVHALIEETVTQIAFTAQTKGLDMVCRLAPGVPSQLMLDPGRLRQVLTNLLNNAAKFTQQGHIYLNIEPVGEHDGQLDLCFRVTDTGIGVEQANLDRIFEKFTQAEAGTTRRFGGTGLGLSISQHLVNLMQGEITATSKVGQGTTFSFTIPLQPSVCDLQPTAVTDESGQRVLVATDHELSGEVLAEQVRTLGHSCQVAIGCKAATTAIDDTGTQAPWTLILVDQSFVERDLPQLKERLDTAASDQRPQVVMLANISSLHKEDQLTQLGLDGALNKPVRLSQLDDILNGRTDTRAAARSAGSAPEAAKSINLETNPDQGPRILLAEDNPFNQKVAVAMLRMLGCRVDVAATGVEAVDMARHHEHDLVLMDCQMPVMDGYEATRRIRQLPAPACEINIVAMTANALSGDRRACFAAGMNDFLSKPITRDMLHDMLEKWDVFADEPEPAPVD